MQLPFSPHYGSNQNVTATSTPATITVNKDDNQIRILNTGSVIAYISCYNSAGTANAAGTSDFPVAPGMSSTITKSFSDDTVGYYCASSTTLSIMTGRGL